MPGFVAEGVVEALDYDFRPYSKAHGTIPEPTDQQIARFMREIKRVFTEARENLPDDLDPSDQTAVLAAINDLDPDAQIAALTEVSKAYSDLCSGTPSAEEISEMPMRVRQIFFAWLLDQVMRPEAVPGGGSTQVTNLRAKRAG